MPTCQVQEGPGEGEEAACPLQGPGVPPCRTIAASRQALPLALSCHRPPTLAQLWHPRVVFTGAGASQEQGQLAPQGRSGSPAESSLHCSRFSMVLLCICWKPAQSHD